MKQRPHHTLWSIMAILVCVALSTLSRLLNWPALPVRGTWPLAGTTGTPAPPPAQPAPQSTARSNKPGFVAGDTILVATGGLHCRWRKRSAARQKCHSLGGWHAAFTTQSGTSTLDAQSSARGSRRCPPGVTATIERFTVLRGDGTGKAYGNGIYNEGNLTLNRSRVSLSVNGIYNEFRNSTLTLNHSVVSDNTGSGIRTFGGSVTINDSTVSGNTSDDTGDRILSGEGSIVTLE